MGKTTLALIECMMRAKGQSATRRFHSIYLRILRSESDWAPFPLWPSWPLQSGSLRAHGARWSGGPWRPLRPLRTCFTGNSLRSCGSGRTVWTGGAFAAEEQENG